MTWTSVCKTRDLKIEDLGSTGRYTPPRWRGQHYSNTPLQPTLSPGTFVFRPAFRDDAISAESLKPGRRPMLWHPIKE
jgi:hypothetical protein